MLPSLGYSTIAAENDLKQHVTELSSVNTHRCPVRQVLLSLPFSKNELKAWRG
jgi:hypothetical protein